MEDILTVIGGDFDAFVPTHHSPSYRFIRVNQPFRARVYPAFAKGKSIDKDGSSPRIEAHLVLIDRRSPGKLRLVELRTQGMQSGVIINLSSPFPSSAFAKIFK